MKLDVLGSGHDTVEEIHQAIARRFGQYDDLREVIVKPNPAPPKDIASQYEMDFIRDENPRASADKIFTSLFGEVRIDSLLGRFAAGDIRVNTWVWEAIWALALFELAKEHASADPPRIQEAMEVSARAGRHVARMEVNGIIGAASVKDGWSRGRYDTGAQITYRERDVFISDKDVAFIRLGVSSKRERAKLIT